MRRPGGRWVIFAVFAFSTSVNILDRQILAALGPTIKSDLHLTGAQYGALISAFAFAYAACAPLTAWLIDNAGLGPGFGLAVALWSIAGVATGFTRSFGSLMSCRAVLGAGESAGMPALAKANAVYLPASEFGLSLAVNNIGITLGGSLAPLLVGVIGPWLGWRAVFLITGGLGLLVIPSWWFVTRKPGAAASTRRMASSWRPLLRDPRLWRLTLSNALIMTGFTIWTNWTTQYLVQQVHLSERDANTHYAWIPPLLATLGGFGSGLLSYRWIRQGIPAAEARMKGCWLAAAGMLVTAALPFSASPAFSTILISAAMFWTMSLQMNIHILPVDIFGEAFAASSVSILACSYGLMQIFVSPAIGSIVDRVGFAPVCGFFAILPLAGVALLRPALTRPATTGALSEAQHA